MAHWLLFQVPCPTSDGRSAADLLQWRVDVITPAMQESARAHGCRFHRAFSASDGSAFWALGCWETIEGAEAFFDEWDIREEPGEIAIPPDGDVGLVPLITDP